MFKSSVRLALALLVSVAPAKSILAQRQVRESRAQWSSAARLTLTPMQRWCANPDADGCDFKGPASVRALPDGGVLASDAQGPLKRFGVDGRFVGTLGRRGKGPGEYGFVIDAAQTSNGLVTWFDITQMRIASIALDGTPGPVSVLQPPYTMAGLYMLDTQLVVLDVPAWPKLGEIVEATYRTVPVKGTPRVLARVRTPSTFTPGSDLRPMNGPFEPRVIGDVGPGGDVAHTNGTSYDIDVFPIKAASWHLSVDAPERAVTATQRDSALAAILKRFRAANAASLPPVVRDAYAADRRAHPPISLMRVVQDGTLWIRTAVPSGAKIARWDVFARDGQRVGYAELPTAARVWDGTRDWVLVNELGPDDVAIIVRYRVSR